MRMRINDIIHIVLIGAIILAAQLCRFDGYPGCVTPRGEARIFPEQILPSTNFWARGLDFSCVSPWNSGAGTMRAGTAISQRHIIFASHYALWSGVRIVFVGEDGGVCPCSITKTKRIGGTDIMIGLLDYELTPNIKPAKVMPDDWASHVGSVTNFPVVTFNQKEQLLYSELTVVLTNGVPARVVNQRVCETNAPIEIAIGGETRRSDAEGRKIEVPKAAIQRNGMIRVGDSGNPAFMIYRGEPVLMYCLFRGGVGHGPWIHNYLNEIQAAMDELEPGYHLTFVDL